MITLKVFLVLSLYFTTSLQAETLRWAYNNKTNKCDPITPIDTSDYFNYRKAQDGDCQVEKHPIHKYFMYTCIDKASTKKQSLILATKFEDCNEARKILGATSKPQ